MRQLKLASLLTNVTNNLGNVREYQKMMKRSSFLSDSSALALSNGL